MKNFSKYFRRPRIVSHASVALAAGFLDFWLTRISSVQFVSNCVENSNFLPFFCRNWAGLSHPLRSQPPSPAASWAYKQLWIGRVTDDQSHLVSTSYKATPRTGKGDHRPPGSRGVFENGRRGHHPFGCYRNRSFGRGTGSEDVASGPGRARALLTSCSYSQRTAKRAGGYAGSFCCRCPRNCF